ncbi:alpha/beta fold hydrolase [Flavobacterium sp. JP2137]|uniref:alpha/beta fold hydrolase n=1 Tax=Flavobacterium sp. JP2137 TaxID=3414510 RepID=UPI003D2FD9E4
MENYILSTDRVNIHYTEIGKAHTTLVFVHGWLGNTNWWNSQEDFFKDSYNIVKIDLGGHGKSERSRKKWTATQYADDIKTVVNQIKSTDIILIGHSMSGAYVVQAALDLPQVKALILIDTLKDLDQVFTPEQAEQYMFHFYRNDFKSAVEEIMPSYLFVDETPVYIKEQLQSEFLLNDYELAINALKPLYEMDLQKMSKQIDIPVRGILSDAQPVEINNNTKYFKDYHGVIIKGTGHYPMLEKPQEFNSLLNTVLKELKLQQ